jgi:hypothetical protein
MPIAHNPETGETLRLDDGGQWVKTQTAKNPQTGEMLAFDGKGWSPYQAKPEPSTLESAAGYVSGLAKSAGHGFTLGLMDEIDAGVNAPFIAAKRALVDGQPFDMGRAYDDRLNQYRAGLKEFREDSPVSAFVGEAAGAVGGTLAVPALRAMTSIPAGASMLSRIGRGAATGAALGGAYGYGSGEGGIANRAEGAMTGAAVGGVLGGIAPPLIEGVRKGGQFVADKTINLLPFRQMGAAERKVAEALMRDGMTPEQAAARLNEMGPEAAIMDLGTNVRGLARGAATVPGEGKTAITNKVVARQEGVRAPNNVLQGGQANRVADSLDDLVPQKGLESMDELTLRRMQAASPAYDEAFAKQGVYSNRLQEFMDDPITKAGLRKGLEVQRLESVAAGKPFNPKDAAIVDFDAAGDPIIGGVPNMRTYDAVKRGLDALIEGEKNQFGKLSERGRALNLFKKAFVGHLDSLNPEYAAARSAYSGPSQLINALDAGRKFMSASEYANPDVLQRAVSKMSPDEQHYFRIGAVQAMRDKVGDSVVRADVTKKLMGNNNLEKRISAAFGDETMYSKYIDGLKKESQMFETYSKITGNSATAERLAEQADIGVDKGRIAQGVVSIVNPASPTGFLRGVADVAGGLRDRAAITGPMSRNLGEVLTGQDVARLNTAMQSAQLSATQRAALIRALQGTGVVAGGRTAPQGQ